MALTKDKVANLCRHPYPTGSGGGILAITWDIYERGWWQDENYLRWSKDGSHILFDFSIEDKFNSPIAILKADSEGSRLEAVVGQEALERRLAMVGEEPVIDTVWGTGGTMAYYDPSPDGSRIVYSACAYTEVAVPDMVGYGSVYNYEIALSNIDGTDVKRLTENIQFDNFPAWSPDGESIAFISAGPDLCCTGVEVLGRLMIHEPATGTTRGIDLPIGDRVAAHSLSWSPDGERIAFVAWIVTDSLYENSLGVYTIRVDGSEFTRISADAASGPAWSPDGARIALAVPEGEDSAALYTFTADGSDPVLVSDNLPEPWVLPVKPWMGDLSWSPDGSEILFNSLPLRVALDGSRVGLLPVSGIDLPEIRRLMLAAWSPDGSRLAIVTDGPYASEPLFVLYTINAEGENARVVVKEVLRRDYHVITLLPAGVPKLPPNTATDPCNSGLVVFASEHSELVRHCRALWEAFENTAPADSPLDWSPERPLSEWEGVDMATHWTAGGSATIDSVWTGGFGDGGICPNDPCEFEPRYSVHRLELPNRGLTGDISPRLARLTELRVLDLSGNALTGQIPPELAALEDLQEVRLAGNNLSGCIPDGLRDVPENDFDQLGLPFCQPQDPG